MSLLPWAASQDCSAEYVAFHTSGERTADRIKYLVLHTTQGAGTDPAKPTSAKGTARYFTLATSGGSAHLVVGDLDCFRTLDDDQIPWAAPPLNGSGLHVELAAQAEWSRLRWLTFHRLLIRRAAYKGALRCHRYGIPPRLLGPAELHRLGPTPAVGGITTHAAISAAFGLTNHTDPGPGFPLDIYVKQLVGYLVALGPHLPAPDAPRSTVEPPPPLADPPMAAPELVSEHGAAG